VSSNEYILLLQKQFSGFISAEESSLLSNWISESPEHERLAQEYAQVWSKSNNFNPEIALDMDQDFAMVIQKIGSSDIKAKRVPMSQWGLRAAAALVVLISATWAWQKFASNPQEMLLAEAKDAKTNIVLSDGSEVWLREGSKLYYPKHFRGMERTVKLDGEAYFIVAHNAQAPFQVLTEQGGKIEVLGTQFDVQCDKNSANASVLVKSGKVRFEPTMKSEGVVLTARQKAVYDVANKKVRVSNETSLNELAWQTGGLEFIDAPMVQSLKEIAEFYKVDIKVMTAEISNCTLTSPLTTGNSAKKVLENIATAYNFTLKQVSDQQFEISGKSCK
jgi:ferric-dicitrate binding protein FerR (iron transport regulator)